MNPDTGQMAYVHKLLEEQFGDAKQAEETQAKRILAACRDEIEEFDNWHEARAAGFEELSNDEAAEMAPLSREERRALLKRWRSTSKKGRT